MSQILEFPKCANVECDNRITEFEVNKISNFKSIQRCVFDFCFKCRYKKNQITRIHCQKCNGTIISNNIYRRLCDVCIKENRRKIMGYKTHREDSNTNQVKEFFINGGVIADSEIKERFGLTSRQFSDIISKLKGQGKIKVKKITHYYTEKSQ